MWPIWKNKDRVDPADYRLISIANHLLKLIERLIRKAITDFINENQLLN